MRQQPKNTKSKPQIYIFVEPLIFIEKRDIVILHSFCRRPPQIFNLWLKFLKGVGAIRPLFGPKITSNSKVIIHILKLLKT